MPTFTAGSTLATGAFRGVLVAVVAFLWAAGTHYRGELDEIRDGTADRGDVIEDAAFEGFDAAWPTFAALFGLGAVDARRQAKGEVTEADVQPGKAGTP